MTVTLRLTDRPDPQGLPQELLSRLSGFQERYRDSLLAGDSVTMNLPVATVASLMTLGVHLSFKPDSSARALPVMEEQAVRIARSLVALNEHIQIPTDPAVSLDPAGGGFWISAKIFVEL